MTLEEGEGEVCVVTGCSDGMTRYISIIMYYTDVDCLV